MATENKTQRTHQRFAQATVILAAFAIACSDQGKAESEPASPEGTNPGECTDAADNDSDGAYDCEDSDCSGSPDCQDDTDEGSGGDTDGGSGGDTDEGSGGDADGGSGGDTDESSEEDCDSDGDGASVGEDCDDTDASLNLADADGDGYSTCDGDCDDTNDQIHPLAGDIVGDDIDSDCDRLDCQAVMLDTVYYAACTKTAAGDSVWSSWSGSNDTCTEYGYDSLAAAHDSSEADNLRQVVLDAGGWSDTWIGLSDLDENDVWTWMDGTEATYFDWGSGEPSPGEENCVEIYATNSWTWNDRPCAESFPFVCELRD